MRVVMAGSSGFLGSALRRRLIAEGHQIVRLVRRDERGPDQRRWDPDEGQLDGAHLAGADLVVNLAGAGIEDRRWTDAYKRTLISSRVRPTRTLAETIAALPPEQRPPVLFNGSAIGFYSTDNGDRAVDEHEPPGRGFFPELCQAWEAAAAPAEDAGTRVVRLRTGLVLDGGGGLLKPIALATKLFASGPLAGGRHWMSWISMEDWVGAVAYLAGRDDVTGPVNVVGPSPVRNAEFTRAVARHLHRPAPWPIPRFALRIALGEFADDAVANLRVLPAVLNRLGYTFAHPTVDTAVQAALP